MIDTGVGNVVWTTSVRSGTGDCASDTSPPSVATWTQTPSDVDADTSGAVTIEATLADDCSGVDTTQDPHLHSRVNGGSDPAFTDAGSMSRQSGTTWKGEIPDQGWGSAGGHTLEYKLVDVRDQDGNAGDSTIQQDPIEGDTRTPITSFTVIEGTVSSDHEASAASDDGDEATFTEAGTGSSPSFTLDADGFRDPNDAWSSEANGFTSNDQYATTQTGAAPIRYTMSSPSSISTVSSVVLNAEVSITNHKRRVHDGRLRPPPFNLAPDGFTRSLPGPWHAL